MRAFVRLQFFEYPPELLWLSCSLSPSLSISHHTSDPAIVFGLVGDIGTSHERSQSQDRTAERTGLTACSKAPIYAPFSRRQSLHLERPLCRLESCGSPVTSALRERGNAMEMGLTPAGESGYGRTIATTLQASFSSQGRTAAVYYSTAVGRSSSTT